VFSVFALAIVLAKADSLPITNFAAKWRFNATQLENVSQSFPADWKNVIQSRFSKRN